MSNLSAEAITPYPILLPTFRYWESKLAGRAMPARRDLDPIDIPRLLPFLILTDVIADPLDFRYRLIGTEVVSRARRDYTGRLFSGMDHTGPESRVWQERQSVVETGRPYLATPPYAGRDDTVSRVVGIHLPLSDDGRQVNMILTAVHFERR